MGNLKKCEEMLKNLIIANEKMTLIDGGEEELTMKMMMVVIMMMMMNAHSLITLFDASHSSPPSSSSSPSTSSSPSLAQHHHQNPVLLSASFSCVLLSSQSPCQISLPVSIFIIIPNTVFHTTTTSILTICCTPSSLSATNSISHKL